MVNHDNQFSKKVSDKTINFINAKDNGVHIFIKLAHLLSEHGMTQTEFSELTGIGQNVVSGMCLGKSYAKPATHYLLAIAEVFDIDDMSEILEIRRNM